MNNQPKWPKPSDRVIFIGVPEHYYPHFTNMSTFCDANLTVGKEYIIHDSQLNSSWCSVYLVGHEQEMLNWGFFEYAN